MHHLFSASLQPPQILDAFLYLDESSKRPLREMHIHNVTTSVLVKETAAAAAAVAYTIAVRSLSCIGDCCDKLIGEEGGTPDSLCTD